MQILISTVLAVLLWSCGGSQRIGAASEGTGSEAQTLPPPGPGTKGKGSQGSSNTTTSGTGGTGSTGGTGTGGTGTGGTGTSGNGSGGNGSGGNGSEKKGERHTSEDMTVAVKPVKEVPLTGTYEDVKDIAPPYCFSCHDHATTYGSPDATEAIKAYSKNRLQVYCSVSTDKMPKGNPLKKELKDRLLKWISTGTDLPPGFVAPTNCKN